MGITFNKATTFLGITFGEKIIFSEQITIMLMKANNTLNLLRVTRGKAWGAETHTSIGNQITNIFSHRLQNSAYTQPQTTINWKKTPQDAKKIHKIIKT